MATSSDDKIAAERVAINSLKSRPIRPPINRNGRMAARLVEVAAVMALVISPAALMEASSFRSQLI
jgi:hypothetical protein